MAKRSGLPKIARATDGRYYARINLGRKPDGSYNRKPIYGKTKEEARSKLIKALHDHEQGLPLPSERQSVAQFLERWLEDTVRRSLRANSYSGYERLVRLHIVPEIGRRTLAKLTPQDVSALYSALETKNLAPRTIQYAHAVLHRALEQAVRWQLVGRNVADVVEPPRSARKEMHWLTPEQSRRFLEAARGDRLYALYVLALQTGMRSGELRGLKWSDVDLDRGKLQVRRQVNRAKGGWEYTEPKTARGRRSIALPALAVSALKQHRAAQLEERLRAGSEWADDNLVFCNHFGKPLERQNIQRRSFKPLLKRAGLPDIRFHDLRHSAATLLLSAGEHAKVVQERLGHATIAITLDIYSHVTPTMQRQAADKLDRVFEA